MPVLSAPVDEELVKRLESDPGLVVAIDEVHAKLATFDDCMDACDELTKEAERLGLYET